MQRHNMRPLFSCCLVWGVGVGWGGNACAMRKLKHFSEEYVQPCSDNGFKMLGRDLAQDKLPYVRFSIRSATPSP